MKTNVFAIHGLMLQSFPDLQSSLALCAQVRRLAFRLPLNTNQSTLDNSVATYDGAETFAILSYAVTHL